MKALALVVAAAVAAPAPSEPLSDGDFQQLMQAAVADGASSWGPPIRTICVQRELDAPLKFVREPAGLGWRSSATSRFTANASLDQSLAAAMSPTARAEQREAMPPLPRRFVMFSSQTAKPPECMVQHVPPPGTPLKPLSVTMTFTRPAFADGTAFINEVDDCPGLCGDGIVRAYRKQNGQWKQVAEAILWVS